MSAPCGSMGDAGGWLLGSGLSEWKIGGGHGRQGCRDLSKEDTSLFAGDLKESINTL